MTKNSIYIIKTFTYDLKIHRKGAKEVTWWLRAQAALSEKNTGFNHQPTWVLTSTCDSSSMGDATPPSGLQGTVHIRGTYTCRQANTHRGKKKLKFLI